MPTDQPTIRLPNAQLLAEHPLIIAANRGPVEFTRNANGTFTHRRGSGGVVTAMSALGKYVDPIWVASAMTEGDRQQAVAAGGGAGRRQRPRPTAAPAAFRCGAAGDV